MRTVSGVTSNATFYDDVRVGAFQAVHQRAADAYVQVEAIRLTAWEAAWRLSVDKPATDEVLVAKYHAARYFLWAVQLEHELGSARYQLKRLSRSIAGRAATV